MKIKKFEQFNSQNWIGPVEILDIDENIIQTNFGNFKNESTTKLTKGYSYLLRIEDGKIIETGMSCVDLVIFTTQLNSFYGEHINQDYKVLSIKRGKDPYKGMWANPGGNIDEGESPDEAAVRELEEETGIRLPEDHLRYIGKFDKPWRDPRNKNCVSYAFMVILDYIPNAIAGDDAEECRWINVDENGEVSEDMAFDHAEVIKQAYQKINDPR
jgi:8-oxo-dGTP diphosphatase